MGCWTNQWREWICFRLRPWRMQNIRTISAQIDCTNVASYSKIGTVWFCFCQNLVRRTFLLWVPKIWRSILTTNKICWKFLLLKKISRQLSIVKVNWYYVKVLRIILEIGSNAYKPHLNHMVIIDKCAITCRHMKPVWIHILILK